MKTLDEFKNDYDWKNAFETVGLSVENLAHMHHFDLGENDGQSWICIAEMDNGKFVILDAWCDYTGWDCQAGGDYEEFETLALAKVGLTPVQASRMDIPHDANINLKLKEEHDFQYFYTSRCYHIWAKDKVLCTKGGNPIIFYNRNLAEEFLKENYANSSLKIKECIISWDNKS